VIVYMLGSLPGAIAKARNHPQADPINICIRLDNAGHLRLPAGTRGQAAVYTGNVKVAGIIRMALMRIASWTNFLFFTS